MQKKSLLVALFCGALCLTGCLKNEESASVAQVRIAKANELNSIAELNKAKAQAEVIYANAEATLKNAQAELEKANAALVMAEAETEKVRAQLLAVQVKLAEVQVEEEKVNLQMMQADLESRLAFLEAEKAAAEAAKQAWVNVLNDLLAQAEIGAIENAKGILDAEQQLEDYILTLEGQKADSAKYYSQLYFAALKDVEEAQVQELEAKAQRVLVNQGAILAREYIHEEIDAANDTIAMNQAFIDALKEHQTMSPEEAQVALIEARKAAGEAYAAYLEALKAEGEARTAANEAFDKTADFTQGWEQFAGKVMSAMPRWTRAYQLEEVTVGEDETERTVEVPTAGIRTWSEENGVEFVPFWNGEKIDTLDVRYPYTDVVPSNQKYLKDIRIVPATINYDNIQAALDNAVEREEAQAERNIARRERRINRQIAALEEDIAEWEDTIALHAAYLAARKDSVAKYEKAYKDAVATAEGNNEAVNSAWEAFQLYMLTEHPTVSRDLFIARNYADTQYQHALIAAAKAKNTYESSLQDTVALKAAVKTAFEDYAKAKGNVVRIADSMLNPSTTAGAIYADKLDKAMKEWNPDFADAAELKDPVPGSSKGTAVEEPFAGIEIYYWNVTPEGGSPIAAGASQDTTLSVEYAVKKAKADEYAAKIDYWAGAKTEAQWKEAQKKLEHAQDAVTAANEREATAWQTYANYYGEMIEALGNNVDIETAFDAFHQNANHPEGKAHAVVPGYPTWNNDVFDFVSFPTDAIVDPTNVDYKVRGGWLDEGEWTDEAAEKIAKAGKAQVDLINAVKDVVDARVNNAEAKATYDAAMAGFATIKANYEKANKELIEAIKGAPMTKDDKIEDYLDEKAEGLYQAYLAALDKTSDVFKALMNLWTKGYASYPDEVGKLFLQELVYGSGSPAPLPIDTPLIPYVEEFAPANPDDPRVSPEDDVIRSKRNFGWLISSYMVDPEATFVGFDGEDHSIAERLFGRRTRRNNPYRNSLQWKVDDANNTIEVELPEDLAKYTAEQNKNVEDFKADVADIMNVVNSYKSFETGYQDWVAEREAAYEAYNETKIATWAAHDDKKAAEDEYEAINAVANEGIYVYDPKHELDGIEASRRSNGDSDYIKISIAKQIEILEEDNERLEGKVEFLRNVLKDGKKVLSVVNEILDQKIEVLSEEVAIKAAIALKYKALMNAYLGIDDEEEAEGETGPLDGEGEGDDEE
jgi:hypothetical protein